MNKYWWIGIGVGAAVVLLLIGLLIKDHVLFAPAPGAAGNCNSANDCSVFPGAYCAKGMPLRCYYPRGCVEHHCQIVEGPPVCTCSSLCGGSCTVYPDGAVTGCPANYYCDPDSCDCISSIV